MSQFQKITDVRMPFDLRSADPKNDFGIHGLDVWFVLKGPKGAVQFVVTWNVYLPHIEREERPTWRKYSTYDETVMGVDVGYHSPKPMYEEHLACRDDCRFVDGGKCYYDGSSLLADKWAKEVFSIRGKIPEEAIWRRLEDEYKHRFEGGGSE